MKVITLSIEDKVIEGLNAYLELTRGVHRLTPADEFAMGIIRAIEVGKETATVTLRTEKKEAQP